MKDMPKYTLNIHPHQLAAVMTEEEISSKESINIRHDKKNNSSQLTEITDTFQKKRTGEYIISVKTQSAERKALVEEFGEKSTYFLLTESMEKEIGEYKISIFLEERANVLGTSELHTRFWETPSFLSDEQRSILAYYLPWKEDIKSDLALVESCFQSAIGFPVRISETKANDIPTVGTKVGKWITDHSCSIGGETKNPNKCLLIQIGEVSIDELRALTPGSNQRRFLEEALIPNFLTEEVDWEIKVIVDKKNQNFFTESPNGFSIIGTNSCVE